MRSPLQIEDLRPLQDRLEVRVPKVGANVAGSPTAIGEGCTSPSDTPQWVAVVAADEDHDDVGLGDPLHESTHRFVVGSSRRPVVLASSDRSFTFDRSALHTLEVPLHTSRTEACPSERFCVAANESPSPTTAMTSTSAVAGALVAATVASAAAAVDGVAGRCRCHTTRRTTQRRNARTVASIPDRRLDPYRAAADRRNIARSGMGRRATSRAQNAQRITADACRGLCVALIPPRCFGFRRSECAGVRSRLAGHVQRDVFESGVGC